ncbi:hypothetical protein ACFL6C_13565, partial [Myxococcota bacterium]
QSGGDMQNIATQQIRRLVVVLVAMSVVAVPSDGRAGGCGRGMYAGFGWFLFVVASDVAPD